jgi:hypothetical protein
MKPDAAELPCDRDKFVAHQRSCHPWPAERMLIGSSTDIKETVHARGLREGWDPAGKD